MKFARMIYSSFHGCDIIVNLIEILAKERNGRNSLGQKYKNRGFDREVCKDDLFMDATSLLIRLKFWQKKGIEGILLESARIEDSIAKFAKMIYSSFDYSWMRRNC